jgi:hypothetical protein
MPLFPAVASLLARIVTPDFWEPRLISLLAVAGTVALILRIVQSETRSWTLAAGGAGLYLMAFQLTGSCYDVARPDSLMLFLALAGLATLRFTTGQTGCILGALMLALAFFTKQHAAWFIVIAVLHMALNERHRLLAFSLWLVVFAGGTLAGMWYWFGPWFSFFTMEVPARWSQPDAVRMLNFFGKNLFGSLGLVAGAALFSLGLSVRPWRGRDGIWMWAAVAGVAIAAMATLDPSVYSHTLMPTVAALAILGPISLCRIAKELSQTRVAQLKTTLGLACGVLTIQFLPLLYPIESLLPHARAAEARDQLTRELKDKPGDVLMPYHGFYSWRAGKGTSLHIIPLDDVVRARGNRLLRDDPGYLERMFQPLHEGDPRPAIVTDVPLAASGGLWSRLENAYTLSGDLAAISDVLRPVTGNAFSPKFVYLPKPPQPLGGSPPPPASDSLLSVTAAPAAGATPPAEPVAGDVLQR